MNAMYSFLKVFGVLLCLLVLLSSCAQMHEQSCIQWQSDAHARDSLPLEKRRHILQRHLEQCPEDLDARFAFAVTLLRTGKLGAGKEQLLALIHDDPQYAKAYYNLGSIYTSSTMQRDLIRAKLVFQRYLVLRPEAEEKEKIQLWLQKNEEIETKGVFLDRKLDLIPELKDALTAYEKKKYVPAAQAFESFLHKYPDDIAVRMKLAACYVAMGEEQRGRDEYIRILSCNQSYSQAYYNLGVVYARMSSCTGMSKARFFFTKYLFFQPQAMEKEKILQWLADHPETTCD